MARLRTIGLLSSIALLAGCGLAAPTAITGSGNIVTQEEAFTGFDKVDVSHAFKVNIKQGDSFRVVVHIDDNLVQQLQVVKQGSTLKIGLKPNQRRSISRATTEAEVTLPELTAVDLSSASSATLSGFSTTRALNVDVSAASNLSGNIDVGNVRLDVSGASQVNLSGSAQDVDIDASGASIVKLSEFPANDATVEASSASQVTVNARGRLDADASGASHVHYLGGPALGTIDTSGASSVSPE